MQFCRICRSSKNLKYTDAELQVILRTETSEDLSAPTVGNICYTCEERIKYFHNSDEDDSEIDIDSSSNDNENCLSSLNEEPIIIVDDDELLHSTFIAKEQKLYKNSEQFLQNQNKHTLQPLTTDVSKQSVKGQIPEKTTPWYLQKKEIRMQNVEKPNVPIIGLVSEEHVISGKVIKNDINKENTVSELREIESIKRNKNYIEKNINILDTIDLSCSDIEMDEPSLLGLRKKISSNKRLATDSSTLQKTPIKKPKINLPLPLPLPLPRPPSPLTRRQKLDNHKCFTCGLVLLDAENLNIHCRMHNIRYCIVCKAFFKRDLDLLRHMRFKHRNYIGKILEELPRYRQDSQYSTRLRFFNVSSYFECKECNCINDSFAQHKKHLFKKHYNKSLPTKKNKCFCSLCKIDFETNILKMCRHFLTKHRVIEYKEFLREITNGHEISWTTEQFYRVRISAKIYLYQNSSDLIFRCLVCKKVIIGYSSYQQHAAVHEISAAKMKRFDNKLKRQCTFEENSSFQSTKKLEKEKSLKKTNKPIAKLQVLPNKEDQHQKNYAIKLHNSTVFKRPSPGSDKLQTDVKINEIGRYVPQLRSVKKILFKDEPLIIHKSIYSLNSSNQIELINSVEENNKKDISTKNNLFVKAKINEKLLDNLNLNKIKLVDSSSSMKPAIGKEQGNLKSNCTFQTINLKSKSNKKSHLFNEIRKPNLEPTEESTSIKKSQCISKSKVILTKTPKLSSKLTNDIPKDFKINHNLNKTSSLKSNNQSTKIEKNLKGPEFCRITRSQLRESLSNKRINSIKKTNSLDKKENFSKNVTNSKSQKHKKITLKVNKSEQLNEKKTHRLKLKKKAKEKQLKLKESIRKSQPITKALKKHAFAIKAKATPIIYTAPPQNYTCKICKLVCKGFILLNRHMLTEHNNESYDSYSFLFNPDSKRRKMVKKEKVKPKTELIKVDKQMSINTNQKIGGDINERTLLDICNEISLRAIARNNNNNKDVNNCNIPSITANTNSIITELCNISEHNTAVNTKKSNNDCNYLTPDQNQNENKTFRLCQESAQAFPAKKDFNEHQQESHGNSVNDDVQLTKPYAFRSN